MEGLRRRGLYRSCKYTKANVEFSQSSLIHVEAVLLPSLRRSQSRCAESCAKKQNTIDYTKDYDFWVNAYMHRFKPQEYILINDSHLPQLAWQASPAFCDVNGCLIGKARQSSDKKLNLNRYVPRDGASWRSTNHPCSHALVTIRNCGVGVDATTREPWGNVKCGEEERGGKV